MSEIQANNKRIAKNTLFMYFRMILSMIVSIYTSRVVLQVLGVEDFGIYNIVGGVVVMFSFINNFLNSACQRFLSFSIAKSGVQETQKVFWTALFVHAGVAVLFALAAETIGLWFLYEKIVIPEPRFQAAVWLYHIYVINTCLTIFKVPYNAAIIAEEKMDFYAYTTITESVLRLVIVYLLVVIDFDKLIVYGLLHTSIAIFMLYWYKRYCEHRMSFCSLSFKYDKKYLRNMVSFSGWNLFGSIADIGYKQGTNIILNIFCGVTLNAAMGLATTVRSTVFNFINNLQVAASPQIIKSYALCDYDYYSSLLYRISKYSYFLMLFFAIPAILNIEYVLELWLGEVPDHTSNLVILGMIFCLTDALHGPLWTSMQATGNIRNYQLCASLVLLLNLPLSYVALQMGYPPESILVVQIAVSILTLFVRVLFSRAKAHLSVKKYLFNVILPITIVTILALPLPLYIATFIPQSFYRLVVTSLASIIITSIIIYAFGVNDSERNMIKKIILKKIIHK